MKRQTKLLLIVIALLLVANISVLMLGKESKGLSYDDQLFAVQDTSSVTSITIGSVSLTKEKQWKVGDNPADPAFVDHLLNILQKVRIKKPVGATDKGITVKINKKEHFKFTSNPTKTKTFFAKNGNGYEVEIPGFSDYLGGIFELDKDQWRDRLVLNGSGRTIQRLRLDYLDSDKDDFQIQFKEDFFEIDGISKIDTATMMNYLNQFQYFQANERISPGRIPGMDSLVNTKPLAMLTLDDIKFEDSISLTLFPRKEQDGFHLAQDSNGEMIAIDNIRAQRILIKKSDFEYK